MTLSTLMQRVASRAKLNRRSAKDEMVLLLKFALGWSPADVEGLPPRRPSLQHGVNRWFKPTSNK